MDYFRPQREPAQSIYDALTAETRNRKGKTFEEWSANERNAVLNAACAQAQALGLTAPTLADVERAERLATGHSDYASKWAGEVAAIMRENRRH